VPPRDMSPEAAKEVQSRSLLCVESSPDHALPLRAQASLLLCKPLLRPPPRGRFFVWQTPLSPHNKHPGSAQNVDATDCSLIPTQPIPNPHQRDRLMHENQSRSGDPSVSTRLLRPLDAEDVSLLRSGSSAMGPSSCGGAADNETKLERERRSYHQRCQLLQGQWPRSPGLAG